MPNPQIRTMALESIKAYTEYLGRVRSINVQVGFSGPLKPVHASLVDSKTLTIQYLDESAQCASVNIPLAADADADVVRDDEIPFDLKVSDGVSALALRIPATSSPTQMRAAMGSFSDVLTKIPWSASYLRKMPTSPDFRCISARDIVVLKDTIEVWKDLPSENWAEMMDFWHCHKPDDPNPMSDSRLSDHDHNNRNSNGHSHNHNHGSHTKYMDTKFLPSEGTAYVGQSYILIHINNLSEAIMLDNGFVKCNGDIIGKMETSTVAKLWKWKLWLESDITGVQNEFKSHIFVSSIIEDLMNSHAIHTFALSGNDNDDERLIIWVFNADISFTNLSSQRATPSLKVFYSTDRSQFSVLKKSRGEIESVKFPEEVLDNLIAYLEHNTALMPTFSTRFGSWKVGVLEKYAA